ncbi:hypothetical protein EH2_01094 [Bacillus subtilis]|nr:hypothetical protein EH2_01094 [Bacillus subtilis]
MVPPFFPQSHTAPAALSSVTGVPVSHYCSFSRGSQLKFKGGKANGP